VWAVAGVGQADDQTEAPPLVRPLTLQTGELFDGDITDLGDCGRGRAQQRKACADRGQESSESARGASHPALLAVWRQLRASVWNGIRKRCAAHEKRPTERVRRP